MRQTTHVPAIVYLVAAALLVDGTLALVGCLIYSGSVAERLYDGIGSAVILITGVTIFVNRRIAVPFALTCAVLLTVDAIRRYSMVAQLTSFSAHAAEELARLLLNILLYWVSYALYRKWRKSGKSGEKRGGGKAGTDGTIPDAN